MRRIPQGGHPRSNPALFELTHYPPARVVPRSKIKSGHCEIESCHRGSNPASTYTCGGGLRMSFNACSHKGIGIAFTGVRELQDLRGDGLFDAVVAVSSP